MMFRHLFLFVFCFCAYINVNAQNQWFNYWKAQELFHRKNIDSALLISKLANSDLPQNYQPLFLAGKITITQKDTAVAMQYFEKANILEQGIASLQLAEISISRHNDSLAFSYLLDLQKSSHRIEFSSLCKMQKFAALQRTALWNDLDIAGSAEQQFIARCEDLLRKNDFLMLDWAADSAINRWQWASAHWFKACAWKGFNNRKIERRELLQAVQLSGKNGRFHAALARNYAEQKAYKQAIEEVTKAINLLPDSVGLLYYRATLKLRSQQYSLAMDDVLQLIAVYPTNDSLWYLAGSIESEQKHTITALPYLNRAIELNSSQGEYFKCRGNTLFDAESFELAERNFSMALDVAPTDGSLYFNRGLCRLKLHETQKACYDFKRAAQLQVYAAQEYVNRTCEK